MRLRIAIIATVAMLVVCFCGCPPRSEYPSDQLAEASPSSDQSTLDWHVYIHNEDGTIRNRYTVSQARMVSEGVAIYNRHGVIVAVLSSSSQVEVHREPVELYEEQYRRLTATPPK
jgi:hypothetical protein